MKEISRRIFLALLFCVAEGVGAQSLWNPGFTGYLTGKSSLQVGDLVSVMIDTNTKLTYTSSDVSSRTITLEFSGGGGGNPLSFLPPGTSGGKESLKGGEEIALSTKLVARVEKLDSTGHAFVQGSRTLSVNGREEMVSLSGWLDPAMTAGGRPLSFDDLADSKLVFSSTLIPSQPVLTQNDISQALGQVSGGAAPSAPAPPAGAGPQANPPPATGGGAAAGTAPPGGAQGAGQAQPASATQQPGPAASSAGGLQLTEAKKRELLTEYLNKMLDLIFSKGTP